MSSNYLQLPPDIPLIIKDIVTDVSDNLQGDLFELGVGIDYGVSFKHDTWKKIQEAIMVEKQDLDSRDRQYPMIMLIEDIQQDVTDKDYNGVKARLDILIVCASKAEYRGEQRRLNSFVPILRPIYAEFMTLLAKSMYIHGYLGRNGYYPHQYREMYNLGTNEGKTAYNLPDFLDGIEIRDLQLQFNNTSLECS